MSDQTETVYANVEEATRALTSDADYSRAIGQPADAAGNYSEMVPANPLPKEDLGPEIFGSDKEGIEQASREVTARRQPTKEEIQTVSPVEISYREQGGTGKPKAVHEIVSAEQAAHDLANFRETLQAQEQAAVDELLRQQVDGERGVQTTEAIGAEPQQQARPQPTPERQQTTAGDDEVSRALQNPKVLAAVQDHVNQASAQAHAVMQAYAQATYANATMAGQNLLANYGELAGLSADQLPVAIQTIERTNPERGAAIRQHVQRVTAMVEEAQRANFAHQQVYRQAAAQQWQHYSAQQDDAYDAWVSKEVTAAERNTIEAEARQMIMEEYGASAQQVAHAWETNPTLRSVQSQKFLFAAARDRLARKGIRDKRDRTPPLVQRPGVGSAERASDEDVSLRTLSDKISRTSGRDQIRAAAELVAARRARR